MKPKKIGLKAHENGHRGKKELPGEECFQETALGAAHFILLRNKKEKLIFFKGSGPRSF